MYGLVADVQRMVSHERARANCDNIDHQAETCQCVFCIPKATRTPTKSSEASLRTCLPPG